MNFSRRALTLVNFGVVVWFFSQSAARDARQNRSELKTFEIQCPQWDLELSLWRR